MTNEKALQQLKKYTIPCGKYVEAYNMAVQALESQDEDCISRKQAIKELKDYFADGEGIVVGEYWLHDKVIEVLDKLPSVTQKLESCEDCCNGIQTEKAKLCQKSYLAGMEHNEPCEDCVSIEDVIGYLCTHCPDDAECFEDCDDIKALKQLPPVTPQPKTGHWEWVQYDGNPNIGNWHCSECQTIIPHMPEETDNTPIYKWCPMCGAKMERSDKE